MGYVKAPGGGRWGASGFVVNCPPVSLNVPKRDRRGRRWPVTPGVDSVTGLMLGETISRCLEAAADTDRGLGIVDRHLNEDWSTYAELDERAAQVAAVLAEYVDVGDRVCLVGPTSLELLAGLFGAWYAGAVPSVLPLPRRMSDAESFLEQIAARLERLGAGVLSVCRGLVRGCHRRQR